MFEPGTKYIHFTKYGGVNIGVVKEVIKQTTFHLGKGVKWINIQILNDKNIVLNLDGTDGRIYEITETFVPLTKEQQQKVQERFDKLLMLKKNSVTKAEMNRARFLKMKEKK